MAKKDFSKYQQGVVGRYYENLGAIKLQALQEIVTELYLAPNENKRQRLWERAAKAMEQLKVPEKIIRHILEQRSPEVLAANVEDWLKGKGIKR